MSNLPTNMGYHTWAVILGADKNGPGKKVQVKTVRRKKNGPFVTVVCGNKGPFDPLPLKNY